jgi:uncharacterized protein (TIGR03382 family)
MTFWFVLGTALAGYGDALDGHPTWEEHALHFYTNAARVAPDAWTEDYAIGGCGLADFQPGERTPKPGLLWSHALGRAARAHTNDMADNQHFAHASSDGTAWDARVRRYYDGSTIGENIARGYPSSRSAVLSGWMCSPGHRANIHEGRFQEIGAAARDRYYTQNFGSRGRGFRVVASALALPEHPVTEVTIATDVWVDPATFVEAVAVIDGVRHPLALAAGAPARGVYGATLPTDGGCHTWFVEVTSEDAEPVRYPEHGSYGWGACAWDDADARWVGWQQDAPAEEPEDPQDPGTPDDPGLPDEPAAPEATAVGCATVSGPVVWPALLLVALVGRRRRAAGGHAPTVRL